MDYLHSCRLGCRHCLKKSLKCCKNSEMKCGPSWKELELLGGKPKCATNSKQLLLWDQTSDLLHGFHQIHGSCNVMSCVFLFWVSCFCGILLFSFKFQSSFSKPDKTWQEDVFGWKCFLKNLPIKLSWIINRTLHYFQCLYWIKPSPDVFYH